MKRFVAFVLLSVFTCFTIGCHHHLHGFKRKRRNVEETSKYEEFDSTALISFFATCLVSTSNLSVDWLSASDWTITDSNWFYYSESDDCLGKDESNETSCWLSRIDSFLTEAVSGDVKECIEKYAVASNDSTFVIFSNGTLTRKRRQIFGLPPPLPRPDGQFPPPNKPPPNRANSRCPMFSRPDYRNELRRDIPFRFRRPSPVRKQAIDDENFNIDGVIEFVENYTVCSECERYSGEVATGCWAIRLDQLTRFDSTLKSSIQRANSRYAGGGDIVGKCQGSVFWTEWYNIDHPEEGLGDIESFLTIRTRYQHRVCAEPSGIQARLSNNDLPYGRGNNVLKISPTTGLRCLNQDQTNGICEDYKIRFCCPGTCSLRSGWTNFFNQSNPGRFGEFETLSNLQKSSNGYLCKSPTAVGARLVSGEPYLEGNDNILLKPSAGLACFSGLQLDGSCNDYKVRFCCPARIGICDYGHQWTRWKDSFSSYGDNEIFSELQKQQITKCESTPSAIEAQVARTRAPYVTSGNKLHISPTFGLLCLNYEQSEDSRCKNFRIRFCCRLPPRRLPQRRPPPPPPMEKLPPNRGNQHSLQNLGNNMGNQNGRGNMRQQNINRPGSRGPGLGGNRPGGVGVQPPRRPVK